MQRTLSISLILVAVLYQSGVLGDETETESGNAKNAPDQPVSSSDEGRLAMANFRKPEGWEVSLFAAEPAVANPVALYVDNKGRVYICESFRQTRGVTDNRAHDNEWLLADLASQTVQDRIDYHVRLLGTEAKEYTAHDDRIRRLEDTDGDRVADQVTIFADGFNKLEEGTGAGVLVRDETAYFTCIPKLWILTDSDGDGQAEKRSVLHDGYGVRVAFRGHDSHGLIIGPDGRLYFSIGDRGYNIETDDGRLKDVESGAVFRCELDGSRLEVFATGLRNPQELAFDDYGYLFTGDNNSDSGDKARWVNVMEGGDSGWRMMYQYLPDRGPFNRESIWQPYSGETPAYIIPPIANIGDGPAGLTCYPGTGLMGDFANCFFMVDFRGGAASSGVRLIRAQPKGAFWELERSEQPIWNILATDVDFGPDGALWVSDWVGGWTGEGKGRIYRFTDSVAQNLDITREVEQLLGDGFQELPAPRLGELLRHMDRRIRLEAQWELAGRSDVAEFKKVLLEPAAGTLARLHGVWGIGQALRLRPELLEETVGAIEGAFSDTDLDVRAAAANVAGELRSPEFAEAVIRQIGDSEPRAQYAACIAAGKLRIDGILRPTLDMLEQNADDDPGLRHAGIMALQGVVDRDKLYALSDHPSRSVRIAVVVALRKLDDVRVADFLNDSDAGVQLEAARAVHDVLELHSALPQLAAINASVSASDALAHRILNANFRLGGEAAAERIAAFAAVSENSDAMRIEAIEMLGGWENPGELDRVMNRYLPIAPRSPSVAKEAFESDFERILVGTEAVMSVALGSAADLGLKGAAGVMREFAADETNAANLRTMAITCLVKLEGDRAVGLLNELVSDSLPTVRAHALRQLADLAPEDSMPHLVQSTKSKFSIEYQSAWDSLARIELASATDLIEDGLEQYLAGSLPPDAWLNVIEAADGRVSEELATRLAEYNKVSAGADPLEAYRECLFGGDVETGRRLFFTKTELSCVRCHKVNGTGGEVGPDLTEMGKARDNRYLLEAIVYPDAKIAEKFGTLVLLTEDDQVITGILREESPSKIVLINADGEEIIVDPVEVVSRKAGKSAMPTDLLKSTSRRDLRDLVAFLSSLKGEK